MSGFNLDGENMKEQLLERLKLMDQAIRDQHDKLQQANADLNMLNGCRQELVHIINLCDQPAVDPVDQSLDEPKIEAEHVHANCAEHAECVDAEVA